MEIKVRIERMLDQDEDAGIWFVYACERGPEYLRAQAWQFHPSVVVDRTGAPEIGETYDALLDLARELLPDSPAGSEEAQDARRLDLFREAARWLDANGLGESGRDAFYAEVGEAWYGTLAEFRRALREGLRSAAREKAA